MINKEKPVILTAAQPTGKLHLGNYLGAIRNWAAMLDDYACYFPIVDLHAMTADYVPSELRRGTLDCVAGYIACGLNPGKCRIFAQSQVIGHTELAWILGCLTPLGQLQRMTQFRDRSTGREGASVGSGLLYYPVLMAADILLYNADVVPVGGDQKQHLELTRDLAEKFNRAYSETFKIPEPYIPKTTARIMSLQDPTRKMAKSDKNQNGVLYLFDPPEAIRKKIMSAVTDAGKEIRASADKPGIANLLNIFSGVAGRSLEEIEAEFSGRGYAEFKTAVAEAVNTLLAPIRKRHEALAGDRDALSAVLEDGAKAAQRKADKMLAKVYRKVGLLTRKFPG